MTYCQAHEDAALRDETEERFARLIRWEEEDAAHLAELEAQEDAAEMTKWGVWVGADEVVVF